MIYYTADLHFGHENVIKFDNRPFTSVEEMDRELISRWNSRVRPEDTVYILGDICFKSSRPPSWYLSKLNGAKRLIIGNHDKHLFNDPTFLQYFDYTAPMTQVKDNGVGIILCHYPLAEWKGYHKGAWHFYAHIHGGSPDVAKYMESRGRCVNVGCMHWDYTPRTAEELMKSYS